MTDKNQKPENPPAFPSKWYGRNSIDEMVIREQWEGMTLLDVFAKEAMRGLLADGGWESIPKSAYDMAELMLAERAKRGIK